MDNNGYTPSPFDTTGIALPEELVKLSEMIARNTHEVWSASRIAEGWVWGPERNDKLKHHPCLIPYEELPEQEKDYDRRTSMEAVRLILALGFEIRRKA